MLKKYVVIDADTTAQMAERTRKMVALGYRPVGSIICGTKKEVVNHPIKGMVTQHNTYLRQSFWYAANTDSPFEDCVKQHNLLESVADNARPCGRRVGVDKVEIDQDIVDVIEAHLRGEEE
tara:strand:- start:286 stop:648 length:363 start_codon:yes stop_codon:yes gene_type:complete